MINPVDHARTEEGIAVYKVEPYVVAADVYALAPHTGRGGWTWYTGSAGWMYRLIVESLLGITREAEILRLVPLMPPHWRSYKIHYRYRRSVYHVSVNQVDSLTAPKLLVDGLVCHEGAIRLLDDAREHWAEFSVGRGVPAMAPAQTET